MALDGNNGKTAAASGFTGAAPFAAIYSTVPSGTAGTELAGVARQPLTWTPGAAGVATASATFTGFAAGAAVAGAGFHSALTGGNYISGGGITARTMQVGDTITVNFTYTQS